MKTAPEMGWASKKNGELLALAAAEFDIFLTAIETFAPAELSAFDIAVIVLVARSNRIDDLRRRRVLLRKSFQPLHVAP